MARLNVNPTRMELTRLKSSLAVARRGHKLLKDKRDELMRQFLEVVKEAKKLRKTIEDKLSLASRSLSMAGAVLQKEVINSALLLPRQEVTLDVGTKNIMSVNVPTFSPKIRSLAKGDIFSYGYAFTSTDLDEAVLKLDDVTADLIRLSELEKTATLMAGEIERTRRRVNALEYVMIPDYEETIRYITMKLDEQERSNTTRLMKVKDMVLNEKVRA